MNEDPEDKATRYWRNRAWDAEEKVEHLDETKRYHREVEAKMEKIAKALERFFSSEK